MNRILQFILVYVALAISVFCLVVISKTIFLACRWILAQ